MTALAARMGIRSARARLLSLAALAAMLAAAVAIAILTPREPANAASVTIPLTRASALIQATSGDQANAMQAVGDQAKVINAALPFDGGPLHSRPAVRGRRRRSRPAPCFAVPDPGRLLRSGIRAARRPPRRRPGRPQPPAPSGFPQVGLRRRLSGRRRAASASSPSSATARSIARPSSAPGARPSRSLRAALHGYVETAVGEATHYHADYVAPRWAPMLTKVAQIGAAHLLSLAGRLGTARRVHRPLYRRAARSLCRCVRRSPSIEPSADRRRSRRPSQAGPPIPRADNDVGGLLDTTKGWTLNIPGPGDSDGAAAR